MRAGVAKGEKAAPGELLKRKPGYACAIAKNDFFFTQDEERIERSVNDLRKAGLPEE